MNNFNAITIPIEDIRIWHSSKWKYVSHSKTTYLHINYDQLLLSTEDTILETINMIKGAIKGVYKGAVLILFIKDFSQTRKLRFVIKSDIGMCIDKLSQLFTVIEHDSLNSKNIIQPHFKNIDEVFRNAINGMTSNDFSSIPLPSSYNNFVKVALLDPTLPQFVCEIEKILGELTKESDKIE